MQHSYCLIEVDAMYSDLFVKEIQDVRNKDFPVS